MSASTELLLEQIRKLQQDIQIAQEVGNPSLELELALAVLNKQLATSQQALNESKLLKG